MISLPLHYSTPFSDIFLSFLFLDPDDLNEVFNLEFLENFDLDKLPDVEKIGEKYIGQIQAAMEELYGDEMMAAMPEDRIQPCLMGVSPFTYSSL